MVDTTYNCEICHSEYDSEKEAIECEERGLSEPVCDVGDIVYLKSGQRWWDGEDAWVINPWNKGKSKNDDHGNCFSYCCTCAFFWVVTEITGPTGVRTTSMRHENYYHVATKARTGKGKSFYGGWTTVDGHYEPVLINSDRRERESKNGHIFRPDLSNIEIPEKVQEQKSELIGHKFDYLL